MSARAKSLILILAALLIGAVLGGLIHSRMVEHRIERIGFLRSERGFINHVERVVEPENDAQREAIRAVLEKGAARVAEHRRRSRREVQMLLDSTRTELDTVLTDAQMGRLEDLIRTRDENRRPRRRAPERR